MRKSNSKLWLLQGPGKETLARPGWSSAPQAAPDDQSSNSFVTLELLDLIAAWLAIVQPHAEVREKLAAVLDDKLPQVEF